MSVTQTIYARNTVSMTDLRRNPSEVIEVANLAPVAGSFTSKRLLPLTHWPFTKASVLSRVGSLSRAKGEVFMSMGVSKSVLGCDSQYLQSYNGKLGHVRLS